jgi:hypothetical protein
MNRQWGGVLRVAAAGIIKHARLAARAYLNRKWCGVLRVAAVGVTTRARFAARGPAQTGQNSNVAK